MNLDTGIRLWRWGNAVSCFGVAQFLFLSALAMRSYPGGTMGDRQTMGYSFSENFLSDLGMTRSWSGKPNGTASLLFNTAMVVLGFSIIPFFLFLPSHAPDQWESLRIAAMFGVVSALALVGIGLSPFDVHPGAHMAALVLWVMSLSSAAVLHFGALWASKQCSPLIALLSFGLAAAISLYMVVAMAADQKAVIMQKCLVLYALVWYMVFGVRMVLTAELRPPDRDRRLRRETGEYLRRLNEGSLAVKPGGPAVKTPSGSPRRSRSG
jgi:hypothetical membrane protein